MSGTRPRMQRAIQCRRSVKSDDGTSFLGRRASRENLIDGDRQATGLSVRGRCFWGGRPYKTAQAPTSRGSPRAIAASTSK